MITRGRDDLPRHFPPGYFADGYFWVLALGNLGLVAVQFWLLAGVAGSTSLAFQCGTTSLQILIAARFVRGLLRDSRKWRTLDRPALLDLYADLDRMAAEHEAALAAFEARHREEMRK